MCHNVSFFRQIRVQIRYYQYVAYIKSIYLVFVYILIYFRLLNIIYSEIISIYENFLTKNGRDEVPSMEIFVVTTYRALTLCSTPEFIVSKNK